jgi:mono/diheme cytochrome c family protein
MKSVPIFLLFSVLIFGLLSSCSSAGETPVSEGEPSLLLDRPSPPAEYAGLKSPKMSDSDIEEGKNKYQINCASCHGESGLGDGPASASLDPKPQPLALNESGLSDGYLFWRISEGGLQDPFNSAMPSWKSVLNEEQIWQVIAYLHQLGKDN